VKAEQARQIWLVDKAPVVIEQLKEAKTRLDNFLHSQGLSVRPDDVANLKGDDARVAFIAHFKEVQRLETKLDQYTDLTAEQEQEIERILPKDDLTAFRGVYLETAQRLRVRQEQDIDRANAELQELDFEFVLFASAVIDYDYIMKLITDFQAKGPSKSTMSREQLVGLIAADSKFIDERETITEYVNTLKAGGGLDEAAIRAGYQRFKDAKAARELSDLAARHALPVADLAAFVDAILARRIFDGEQLTELLAPLGLGWKERSQKELALMADLVPLLKKRAAGREISGLKAYEE
jgi:type I restriction enzyme R subunit